MGVRKPPENMERGSAAHGTGACKPCELYWTPQGCPDAARCMKCHLCKAAKLPSCCGRRGTCEPCTECGVRLQPEEIAHAPSKKTRPGMALKRLRRELETQDVDIAEYCSAAPIHGDMLTWRATLSGPSDSIYAGGKFLVKLQFPQEYPFLPPLVHFITPVYHCNVSQRGGICLDILHERWTPSLTISKLLLSILSMLVDCNPGAALRPEVASVFMEDRDKHDEIAREWVRRYAMP